MVPHKFSRPRLEGLLPTEVDDPRSALDRLREDPGDLDALEAVGAYLLARGQADKALVFFHWITRANPEQPGIWQLKAKAFEAVGDAKNADACRRRGASARA